MVESINAGLHSTPGRNPEKADQEFGTSRSLEETFDNRGSVQRILEESHDTITSSTGKSTSYLAGMLGVLSLNEERRGPGLDAAAELSAQYPEAAAVVITGTAAGIGYNAADEIGLLSNARAALDPNQMYNGDDSAVELNEDWVDSDKNEYGISVDAEDVDDLELDPNMDAAGYAVLHEGLEDISQK